MQPTPMTLIYLIFAVLITFWFVVPWGLWPVSAMTKSQFVIGLSVLLVTYLVGYLLFYLLFDFAFLKGAPVYFEQLDPMGAFDANTVLSFSVTTVTVVFVLIMFDFWPITAVEAFRKQPMMGVATTIFIFVVTGIIWGVGVYGLGFNPVKFQAYGSIGLLFGCLVPVVMFEGKLFEGAKQPVAGIGRLVIAGALRLAAASVLSLAPADGDARPRHPDAGCRELARLRAARHDLPDDGRGGAVLQFLAVARQRGGGRNSRTPTGRAS